jgi:hypothetical protein
MRQTFIDLFLVLHQYFFIYVNIDALIACHVALFVSSFVSLRVAVRFACHNDCKAKT